MTNANLIKRLIEKLDERIELEIQCQDWKTPDVTYTTYCEGYRQALYDILGQVYGIDLEEQYEAFRNQKLDEVI